MNKNIISDELLHNNESATENFKFPYEIKKLDSEANMKILQLFTGEKTGFVQVGPKNYFLPIQYESSAESIYNFKVRPDDVWIVTYPRSGTTWTLEMVWLLEHNHDYDTAMKSFLFERCPYLETTIHGHPDVINKINKHNNVSKQNKNILEQMFIPNWTILEKQTGKRIIKTHLPFSLLPPDLLTSGCKVVYVARNPKNAMLSYFHFSKLYALMGYNGDLEQYMNLFMEDSVTFSPYWSHVEEAWKLRHSENLLFMLYEDMSKDLRQSIKKVANFLEKKLTEEQLEKLDNHLQFDNFRNNPMVNYKCLEDVGIMKKHMGGFMRNRNVPPSKDNANAEMFKKFDEWVEINSTKFNIHFDV
ncbi:hypothetical protein FQR65_LT05948 [Abscondita terminalis]|nr:hypothetical protein FQR65_LT05948 [Abscondita terminalis]